MRRSNGRAFVASAFTVAAGLLLVAVVYFVQRPGRVEAAKHVELQQQPPPNYQFTPLQTMPQYQAQQSMPPLQQYAPASQSPMAQGAVQNPQAGYPPPPALAQGPAPAPAPVAAIDTAAVDPMAPSFVVPPTPSGAFSSPCSAQFTVQALGLHQHDKITLALVSGPPGSSITTPITSNPGSTIFTWQPTPQQLQQLLMMQQQGLLPPPGYGPPPGYPPPPAGVAALRAPPGGGAPGVGYDTWMRGNALQQQQQRGLPPPGYYGAPPPGFGVPPGFYGAPPPQPAR